MSTSLKQIEPFSPHSHDSICRICFESESESLPLIFPCKCSGSMRYIHEDCLKIWLLSQSKDLSAASCDICKFKFQMRMAVATRCTCKNCQNECLGIFVFPVLLILMTTILLIVTYFLVQGIETSSSSAGEITYLSLLIVACTVILLVILLIFINSLRRGCCSVEVVTWQIESLAPVEVEETVEQINNMTQNAEEPPVLVLQKEHKLNGRKLIRPQIQGINMIKMVDGDEIVGFKPKPLTIRSAGAIESFSFNRNEKITHLSIREDIEISIDDDVAHSLNLSS
jgi:hypothetical protein